MGQRTPLYDRHRALGARMIEFAGWEMPVSYRGATEEHHAVRRRCGLFDVGHMGEIEVRGPGSAALVDALTVNAVADLAVGAGQYSVFCDVEGGVVDDLIVYRLGDARFLLVVNAANTASDLAWVLERRGAVEVIDQSAETALVALQGPRSAAVLQGLTPVSLETVRRFTIHETVVAGVSARIARTGYTGEDGFEVFSSSHEAVRVWDGLVEAMASVEGAVCGLAARDTLRLEAALPLCGTDMDRSTTPLEASLGWVVKLDKGEFVGREALRRQLDTGVPRRLVGIEMEEPAIPRHGFVVEADGRAVGAVTSGTKSPTLDRCLGLAYVSTPHAAIGARLTVGIRGRWVGARVVPRPFYRRPG